MIRYLFTLSQADYVVLGLLTIAGFLLLTFTLLKRKHVDASETKSKKIDLAKPQIQPKKNESSLQVMEIFDYNGTKILHQDGAYTVNDKGVVTNYLNWNLLPKLYQLMVKELDKRSLGEKGQDYFLEILNGFYYVSLPGGKKKRYNTIGDIPPQIRKKLGV